MNMSTGKDFFYSAPPPPPSPPLPISFAKLTSLAHIGRRPYLAPITNMSQVSFRKQFLRPLNYSTP